MAGRIALRVALLAGCVAALSLTAGCARSDGERSSSISWGSIDATIEAVNVDGSGRRVVAPQLGDDVGDPAWSRDGRAVAFYVRNSDTVEIHVLWPKDGVRRVLTSDWRGPAAPRRQFAYILEPNWAPDGEHLALSDSWTLENAVIRVVSLSGRRWRSLTTPSSRRTDTAPAWSPDGRTIAFVRQAVRASDGPPVILLIGQDGRDFRRLARGRSPSWSPDSENLVYASGDSIYRIGSDGRGRTRIIGGLKAPEVRWSPDGRKLLYTTSVGEDRSDLWVMNRDGTHRTRILRNTCVNGFDWQPG